MIEEHQYPPRHLEFQSTWDDDNVETIRVVGEPPKWAWLTDRLLCEIDRRYLPEPSVLQVGDVRYRIGEYLPQHHAHVIRRENPRVTTHSEE